MPEHAHHPSSFSLFASWPRPPVRGDAWSSAFAAVGRILRWPFSTRPHVRAMSGAWLRQYEAEAGKHHHQP